MSTLMNEGVKMYCKVVTANLFTLIDLLVEPSTYISKTKGYLEAYISIRQPIITVTSISPVIPPSLDYSFMEVCLHTIV